MNRKLSEKDRASKRESELSRFIYYDSRIVIAIYWDPYIEICVSVFVVILADYKFIWNFDSYYRRCCRCNLENQAENQQI